MYVVDAFAHAPFTGNPAGVCLLGTERDSAWMQSVAAEMKHAETAFVRPIDDGFELRWFTPTVEVDLCGHATLASAHVLWESGNLAQDRTARFHTRSGLLTATLDCAIKLDFPSEAPEAAALPHAISGLSPIWTGKNRMDWIAQVASEEELRTFVPDIESINALGMRGLIVTAAGSSEFDFVSRFFAPQSGVPEDPVTGSAHCCLAPFWGSRLGKTAMSGYQASERGGKVGVELKNSRVVLSGQAITVLEGTFRC